MPSAVATPGPPAAKVRADLIAGLPFGIWLSVLLVLVILVPMVTIQVMVAGPLLHQRGPRLSVLLPYLERAFPATALIGLTCGWVGGFAAWEIFLRHNLDVRKPLLWTLPLIGTLALALTGALRGWAWPVRLLLHAVWLVSLGLLAVQWMAFR
jgi:hypothetical protein